MRMQIAISVRMRGQTNANGRDHVALLEGETQYSAIADTKMDKESERESAALDVGVVPSLRMRDDQYKIRGIERRCHKDKDKKKCDNYL